MGAWGIAALTPGYVLSPDCFRAQSGYKGLAGCTRPTRLGNARCNPPGTLGGRESTATYDWRYARAG